jgi:DNA-binding Lrp family transcriptional regulator
MGQSLPLPALQPHPQWWRIGRASLGFILDVFHLTRNGGDILGPLISSVIIESNVALINQDPEVSGRYAALDTPPPDELRRPISINAVATSLRLPYETVRRRVAAAIAAGTCVATPKGVYVPAAALQGPAHETLLIARYERLKQFYFELKALEVFQGVNLAPPGAPVLTSPPVRAGNRAISEYSLRVIEGIMRRIGDPLTGILLLEMTRANAEPTDRAHFAMDAPLPDMLRVPVTTLTLARRLGLPAETVRRHVAKLDALGFCRKTKGGRLAALEQLGQGNNGEHGLADNLINVQRLFAKCAALGIVPYWEAEGPA